MLDKKLVVQAIIEKAELDYDDLLIKTSVVEGYEKPDKITLKGTQDKGYVPDVWLRNEQTTELYEVELGQDYQLDKWRLFSLYSNRQNGNFNIVTPEDHLHQLRSVLNEHQIHARILYFT